MVSLAATAPAWLVALWINVGITAPPGPDYSGNCTDAGCHDQYAKRAFAHGPVAVGSCDACHEQVGTEHKFKYVAELKDLCYECHDEFEGQVAHQPVAEGQCLRCHDPHGSASQSLIKGETVGELCAQCHKETTEGREFLHGPAAVGACTVCHNPHAADQAALLSMERQSLCFKCHTTMQKRLAQEGYKHAPVTEDCMTCHDPHGADNRMNLSTAPPELCLDCHDSIADTLDDATVTHDAVTMEDACLNCHDPHVSKIEHNLLREPMDLCLTCHDKELGNGENKVMNMAKLLSDNPDHHGPIREKNCQACHQVHGGENFRLLIKEYPPEFYAPFQEERYSLCFECHEPDVVQDERTDTLTGFRNGDRNLHYLHVHREVKGRTCRACHNTHASKRPKHITESVPFGNWELPINYRQTATGGSCQPGCHKLYRYDRNKPVVNVPKAGS
jgi:predicted CXXCH cytochrome family protein